MTPAYAAPEQLRSGPVGVTTDVYSLGVVLYELLGGRLPFDLSNRSSAEAEAIILEQQPPKPSSVAATKDVAAAAAGERADLDVMCLTAMHKEPARRYRSVEALIQRGVLPSDKRVDDIRSNCRSQLRQRSPSVPVYAVSGLALGERLQFDSAAYREYKCSPSDQFGEFTWC